MHQPANMSGVQVIVLAQAAPIDNQSRYLNVTSEFAQMFTRLGVAHGVIGALCIIFQIISFAFLDWSAGHGIWTGSLFVVTGVFGILAGKKGGKCQVIAFHVLSTISAVFALILLCIAAPSAANNHPHGSFYNQGVAAMVTEALLAVLALAEGIVALCSSVTGCTIGACCCNCGGSCCCPADPQYQQFQNPIEPDLSQQQFFTSNQQQPMFNTNQQQARFNANQQQPMNTNQHPPMFNTIQQQQVFNPNQQQLMFSPNNQQLMFNPNQQQLIFNPNQQQLMFNYNHQQPMSFPIQPLTGFYPQQQQAVQLYAHQPNATLNSQQPDFSAFSSGATGQRPDAGPNSEPTATPLPEETTGNGGGDGSDEGPGFADDVEMLSLEGPFVESENRF